MTDILIEIRESRQPDHPFEERKRQAKLRRARDMASASTEPSETDFKSRLEANGSDRLAIRGEVDQLAVDIQADDCPTEASERFMALFPMTLAPASWWEPVSDLPLTITRARSRLDEIEDTLAFLLEPVVPEPADAHNFPENLTDKLSDWDTVQDEASLTTADLTEDVVVGLSKPMRKRFTELLNVELAELLQERGGPREDLAREAECERLLDLFARVGSM